MVSLGNIDGKCQWPVGRKTAKGRPGNRSLRCPTCLRHINLLRHNDPRPSGSPRSSPEANDLSEVDMSQSSIRWATRTYKATTQDTSEDICYITIPLHCRPLRVAVSFRASFLSFPRSPKTETPFAFTNDMRCSLLEHSPHQGRPCIVPYSLSHNETTRSPASRSQREPTTCMTMVLYASNASR